MASSHRFAFSLHAVIVVTLRKRILDFTIDRVGVKRVLVMQRSRGKIAALRTFAPSDGKPRSRRERHTGVLSGNTRQFGIIRA